MSRFDWRAWTALAWTCVFGVLYVAMVIRERFPSLAETIRGWLT